MVSQRAHKVLQVEVSLREPHEVYFSETSQQTLPYRQASSQTGRQPGRPPGRPCFIKMEDADDDVVSTVLDFCRLADVWRLACVSRALRARVRACLRHVRVNEDDVWRLATRLTPDLTRDVFRRLVDPARVRILEINVDPFSADRAHLLALLRSFTCCVDCEGPPAPVAPPCGYASSLRLLSIAPGSSRVPQGYRERTHALFTGFCAHDSVDNPRLYCVCQDWRTHCFHDHLLVPSRFQAGAVGPPHQNWMCWLLNNDWYNLWRWFPHLKSLDLHLSYFGDRSVTRRGVNKRDDDRYLATSSDLDSLITDSALRSEFGGDDSPIVLTVVDQPPSADLPPSVAGLLETANNGLRGLRLGSSSEPNLLRRNPVKQPDRAEYSPLVEFSLSRILLKKQGAYVSVDDEENYNPSLHTLRLHGATDTTLLNEVTVDCAKSFLDVRKLTIGCYLMSRRGLGRALRLLLHTRVQQSSRQPLLEERGTLSSLSLYSTAVYSQFERPAELPFTATLRHQRNSESELYRREQSEAVETPTSNSERLRRLALSFSTLTAGMGEPPKLCDACASYTCKGSYIKAYAPLVFPNAQELGVDVCSLLPLEDLTLPFPHLQRVVCQRWAIDEHNPHSSPDSLMNVPRLYQLLLNLPSLVSIEIEREEQFLETVWRERGGDLQPDVLQRLVGPLEKARELFLAHRLDALKARYQKLYCVALDPLNHNVLMDTEGLLLDPHIRFVVLATGRVS